MAQQHTTPEKSLASAYAAEQRAQAGIESRLRKDPCYGLYEASLKCLDQNDYQRDLCTEAFDKFSACRSNLKSDKAGGQGTSAWDSMVKAQEKDPLLGPIMRIFGSVSSVASQVTDTVAAAVSSQPPEDPEPEWKVVKRQREADEQRKQQMQAAVQQQQQEQQQQQQQQQQQESQGSRRRWFTFGFSKQ